MDFDYLRGNDRLNVSALGVCAMKGRHKTTADDIRRMMVFIIAYAKENGYMPSYSELMDEMKISRTTLGAWLGEIQGQGLAEVNGSRAINVRGLWYEDGENGQ